MPEKATKSIKRAVVLLSGGLDSSVTLAHATREGFFCDALTFAYGQRHNREVISAKKVARAFGVARHVIIPLDPVLFHGSALTGSGPVPLDRGVQEMPNAIPATYVPARNTVFLAMALAYAEHTGASDILIGANAVDYSGYPDCRPEFIKAFEHLANIGTKAGVSGRFRFHVRAPLISKTKSEIVALAYELGVDPSLTWSCYSPDPAGRPCMRCDSCLLRRRGFEQAGRVDPLTG